MKMVWFAKKKTDDQAWKKIRVEVFSDTSLITIGHICDYKGTDIDNGIFNELTISNDFYEDLSALYNRPVKMSVKYPNGNVIFANCVIIPNRDKSVSSNQITLTSIVIKQKGDRRQSFRLETKGLKGDIWQEDHEEATFAVDILDLSLSGCKMKCNWSLLDDRQYELSLNINGSIMVVPLKKVRDISDNSYGMHFNNSNTAIIDGLSSYIQNLQLEEIRERKRRTL